MSDTEDEFPAGLWEKIAALSEEYDIDEIAEASLVMMDEIKNPFRCIDCYVDTRDIGEYYMVHDHLWEQAGMTEDGMLCFDCLETRIGRALTVFDFINAPVNDKFIEGAVFNRKGGQR